MFFKSVAIVCLIGLSTFGVNAACGDVGKNSNVKCVTKTEFRLPFQADMLNKCPPGTVCADYPNICVSDSLQADCANEREDGKACNDCRDRENNEPVCISQTEYALCRNKEVDASRAYPCVGFCKATIESSRVVSICTLNPKELPDCLNPATTTTAADITTTTPTMTTPTMTTPITTTPTMTTPTTITSTTTDPTTTDPTTTDPTTTDPTTTDPTTTDPTTTDPTTTDPTTTDPTTIDPTTTDPTTTDPTTITSTTTDPITSISTTTDPTAVPGTRCTAEGFYPDTSVQGCQKYIKCTKGEGDTLISQSLSCNAGFNFNAATKRCVPELSYQCPGDPSPTVPVAGCIAEGFYPDTSDCQKYIKCTKGEGDTFISQSLSCNAGFNFNAATKRCVPQSSYQCPGPGGPSPTVPVAGCIAEGFYPDTSVPNCQNYMKCTKGTGETFDSVSYPCADGFSFNATTKRCVPKSSYQCPAP